MVFNDLHFGDFLYELFHYNDEILEEKVLELILEIKQGSLAVITVNDEKNKKWLADACYDRNDTDDFLGEKDFKNALKRIHGKKSMWEILTKSRKIYEVYDWNSYECFVK